MATHTPCHDKECKANRKDPRGGKGCTCPAREIAQLLEIKTLKARVAQLETTTGNQTWDRSWE